MTYRHVHVSEVPDSPVVECTSASVLEVARAATNGLPSQPPATAAEREALRAASGASDVHGASIPLIAAGARRRYGVSLDVGPLPDLERVPEGTFIAVQGDYHVLPRHFQRWDPHFALRPGAGHCVTVFSLGGLRWCDPLAPWGAYAGEPVAPSVVRAYFASLPGAQTASALLRPPAPAGPPAAIGPRPDGATGWLAVDGAFFRWHPGPRRTAHRGRFSAWASEEGLAYDGRSYPGFEVLSGGYGPHGARRGWLVFPGSAVRWHPLEES